MQTAHVKWIGEQKFAASMLCVSLATPGTEACDAVGGALRPKCGEWPARCSRRVLSVPSRVSSLGLLRS
jgi:hypothetical protein